MEQKDFLELAAKVADGKASDEELKRYAAVYEYFRQQTALPWDTEKYGDERRLAAELDRRLRSARKARVTPFRVRPLIAAASLLALLAAAYLFFKPATRQPVRQLAAKDDVAPGRNQATLILASGKKVILTPQSTGEIALQGQTRISALNGQLVYQPGAGNLDTGYNTVTTARGEQSPIPIVLADGTRVWLNAESSLTFPAAFTGSRRVIRLSGEAYFEVRHETARPFIVHTADATIEDIGTHFDIHSYPDDKEESTTLLEGAVKVTTPTSARLLTPGEQANYKQGKIVIRDVDAEEAIAWKNGYFMFTDIALGDVMRELSRWYNVDVRFEKDNLKELPFVASITKYTNVSKVLQVLEMTKQVHFKIEGNVINVYPR